MRKIAFLLNIGVFVFALLTLDSCSQDECFVKDEVTPSEKKLNLQAPNGEYLAENISALKEILAFIIEQSHEESKDFEIVSIQFEAPTVGFIADVEYVTKDGIESNVIIESNNTYLPKIRTRAENEAAEKVYYKCKSKNDGKCETCRTIKDKKTGQIYCGCNKKGGLVEGCKIVESHY